MKVGRKLLPIKLHYFFFMAASGPILPHLTVYGKELGVSEVVMGCITAILPVFFLMAKPLFGLLFDYFKNRRKLIFMLLIAGMSLFYVSLFFIPPSPSNNGPKTFSIEDSTLTICNSSNIDPDEAVRLNCTTPGNTRCQFNVTQNTDTELLCASDDNDCKLENDKEIICYYIDDRYQLYKSSAFYGYVVCMSLAMIAYTVCNSISDAICFDMLGDDGATLYGSQRVWGTVGFGVTALAAGFGMDYFSQDNITNYTPAFILVLLFTLMDLWCCTKLWFPQKKMSSENILGDVGKLLKSKKIIIFLCFTTLAGVLDSFIIYFLFWFLEDLSVETNQTDSIKTLEGLTVAAETLGSEMLLFPLFGKILNKIGYNNSFTLCFFNYGLRLTLISLIPSPWWIILIELFMQGPTYAFTYTVIVSYANEISLPGTSATMQGLVAGMDDGLGYALGSLIGGFLYKLAGGRLAFQCYGLLSFIVCTAHFILHKTYFSKNLNEEDFPTEKESNHEIVKLKMGEMTKL